MSIKDILVHIDHHESCKVRTRVALDLALEHGAYLTGLYVIPNVVVPAYAEVHIPRDILEAQIEEANKYAEKAQAQFLAAAEQFGVQAQYKCCQGYADQEINRLAHYADLVIVRQSGERPWLSEYTDLPDQIVLSTARPVLFIPYVSTAVRIGKRVLVAWNDRREAARAVHDALPILMRADYVSVVAVNSSAGAADLDTVEICQYLARHGVNAQGQSVTAKDIHVGDCLMSWAADHDLDLIVMGAYGHSRFREFVLGGVSEHMLHYMTVPVLMSR